MPVTGGIGPLVLISHGDSVVGEGPQVLDEPVIELPFPLAGKESADRSAAGYEFTAVAPDRVLSVGQGHAVLVAGVPAVPCQSPLLRGPLERERRSDY